MDEQLQRAVYTGEYALGAELFQRLDAPTAEDDRWGGICNLHLGHVGEAMLLLHRAIQGGCGEARIELISAFLTEGRMDDAEKMLQILDTQQFTPMNTALALRVRAVYEAQSGQLTSAKANANLAWYYAATAPLPVQATTAQLIGLLAAREGDDVRAAEYLALALSRAHRAQRVYVCLALAASLTYTGRFDEATGMLEKAKKGVLKTPYAQPVAHYGSGVLAAVQQDWSTAINELEQAAATARQKGQKETEFYASYWLSYVQDNRDSAKSVAAFARARHLAQGELMETHVKQLSGFLNRGQPTPASLTALTEAVTFFRDQLYWRHALSTHIILAESLKATGDHQQADVNLTLAADLYHSLAQQHDLQYLISKCQLVQKWLANLEPTAYQASLLHESFPINPLNRLDIIVLGQPRIQLNGNTVEYSLKRLPEIMAFVHQHPGVGLLEIQRRLFTDVDPKQAKNYFHQAKLALKRLSIQIHIEYDKEQKGYYLAAEDTLLTLDLQEIGIELDTHHTFSPAMLGALEGDISSEEVSDWLLDHRNALRSRLLRSGIKHAEMLLSKQEYENAMRLSVALLALDDLDVELHLLCIICIERAEGSLAASMQAKQSRNVFTREFGSVPERSLHWQPTASPDQEVAVGLEVG